MANNFALESLIASSNLAFVRTNGNESSFGISATAKRGPVVVKYNHSENSITAVSDSSKYKGTFDAGVKTRARISRTVNETMSAPDNDYSALGFICKKRVSEFDTLPDGHEIIDMRTCGDLLSFWLIKKRLWPCVAFAAADLGIAHVGVNQYSKQDALRVNSIMHQFPYDVASILVMLHINQGEFVLRKNKLKEEKKEEFTKNTFNFLNVKTGRVTEFYTAEAVKQLSNVESGMSAEDTTLVSTKEACRLFNMPTGASLYNWLRVRDVMPVIRGHYLKKDLDDIVESRKEFTLSVNDIAERTNVSPSTIRNYMEKPELDGFFVSSIARNTRFSESAVDVIEAMKALSAIRKRINK